MKHNRRKIQGSRGVIFVEFVMVAIIFFATLGFFIFFGIYLYRVHALTDSLTSTLRKISVDPQTLNYTDLEGTGPKSVLTKTKNFLKSRYDRNASTIVLKNNRDVSVCHDAVTDQCRIRAKLTWRMPCYGYCIWFPKVKDVVVTADTGIEDPCFNASTTGCFGAPGC